MTTNIGKNKNSIGFNTNEKEINQELKDNFNIAFLNRIDDIITFNSLNKQNITTIINRKIDTLKDKFKEANITIMTAKASKDDGHIEGKIVNNTNEMRMKQSRYNF